MSLATIHCRAAVGIHAPAVTVEVHLANGLPAFNIVGLPEKAVQESKERVRSALLNSGCDFPARRITCNLAPADLPKEGGRFDLAIAVGILAASGQIPTEDLDRLEFLGELNLAGEIRPIRGALPAALAVREQDRALILPSENRAEAALVAGLDARPADHLLQVLGHCTGTARITSFRADPPSGVTESGPDLAEVIGQAQAKRALEITAAGGHNLLFVGPPGTGKSMLACRLPGILPEMNDTEALETAAIESIGATVGTGESPTFDQAHWRRRPFRTPHHTASGVALVGGGSNPRPGEISLAHNGVLFLDELPEFDRRVLEVLREPLESGHIIISRAARQAEFPAHFQLIAAMNPCPCGHLGDARRHCRCTAEQIARYRARISGPLLDRIDLQVEVPAIPPEQLQTAPDGEPSRRVRARIARARDRQLARQGGTNARLANAALHRHCALDPDGQALLTRASERLALSARGYHRILRVARSIADLDLAERIRPHHLSEAISYRSLDRRGD